VLYQSTPQTDSRLSQMWLLAHNNGFIIIIRQEDAKPQWLTQYVAELTV